MINTVKDTLLLMKDSARSQFLTRPKLNRTPLVEEIIRHLGIRSVKRVIVKESTTLIITSTMIVRVPRDKVSVERCEVNKEMLESLVDTKIASSVPLFLYKGHVGSQAYYCEERLSGYAIDIPISKMNKLVMKAAEFLTSFHKETAKAVTIDEKNFKTLFANEFDRLLSHIDNEYISKVEELKAIIKKKMISRCFKTVWAHGDYNIENALFDTKAWHLQGVIDWDLAQKEGLPLIDIIYLLLYKNSLLTKKSMAKTFKERFLERNFAYQEKVLIHKYLNSIAILEEFLDPLLIMFWVNHVSKRYHDHLVKCSTRNTAWMRENVYDVIDMILEKK